jgi:hypothetical protein
MSLLLCPQQGCRRKYKTEETLRKHLDKVHHLKDADLVDVQKVPTKAEKDCRRQEREHIELEIARRQLQSLHRVKENPELCAICFERPSGGAAVIPCGHSSFCFPCLTNVFEHYKGNGCPLCRGEMSKIQVLF